LKSIRKDEHRQQQNVAQNHQSGPGAGAGIHYKPKQCGNKKIDAPGCGDNGIGLDETLHIPECCLQGDFDSSAGEKRTS
jgi:hypothetical protein